MAENTKPKSGFAQKERGFFRSLSGFTLLCLAVAGILGITLLMDLFQHKITYPGKQVITFASMWAPGEPVQLGYEQIFRDFEKEYPQYKVEARWEGRWVIPAIRPRLLTHSDIPDIINVDRDSLRILVENGFMERLDDILDQAPHPDDKGKTLRQAFLPKILDVCRFKQEEAGGNPTGVYLVPSGVWTVFVFYNRYPYEKLKLKIPRTWSAFMDNCRKLKAAGYVPIAADKDEYANMWEGLLLCRAVGEKTLHQTVTQGFPRFDTDPRYRRTYEAIREMHQPGWFIDGWLGSQWPAAQRRWVSGDGVHLICGSWIIREVMSYQPDPKIFKLGGFMVPMIDGIDWKGRKPLPLGDSSGVTAAVTGHALFKGGRNKQGAILLLSYIAKRQSAYALASIGKEIPPIVGASFPPELEDIRQDFQSARIVYTDSVSNYAAKWFKFIHNDLFHDFFIYETPKENGYLTVDEFLRQVQKKTDEYVRQGGEKGIK